MQLIFDVHDNYCWWFPESIGLNLPSTFSSNYDLNLNYSDQFVKPLASNKKKEIKARKRRNSVIDIEKWIENIYDCLRYGTIQLIIGRSKQKPLNFETPKGRGSNYIGVSKNGENWQVLINWGKFKKYIGTFKNEKEAAISYDFFSICLHASKAKTNFTYSSTLIAEMVESYDRNTKTFDALRFIDRV